MLPRTASSVRLSRQSLPRPARLHCLPRRSRPYSTPSKSVHAPATATAQLPANEYPAYLQPAASSSTPKSSSLQFASEFLGPFLARPVPYTILPTPLPAHDQENDPVFADSRTQDQLAVVDACLHGLFNVPRAKQMFNKLRQQPSAKPVLHATVYNNVLSAYIRMAQDTTDAAERKKWVTDAWSLYNEMVSEEEGIPPNSTTYALMLSAWHRFSEVECDGAADYARILDQIAASREDISVVDVVQDRSISDPTMASEIIGELSRVGLDRSNIDMVNALAKAHAIASGHVNDQPEAMLAKKPAKSGDTAEATIPLNIQMLHDHLSYVAHARRVLPDDILARQRHLELSAYDMAEERFKVQNATLDGLGVTDGRYRNKTLQQYMYQWHEKLTARLKEQIALIAAEERKPKRQRRTDKPVELSPFFSTVTPERLSMITILEIMRLTGTGGIAAGMKSTRAVISVGKAVEMEYKARLCRQNHIPLPESERGDTNVFTQFGYSNLYERRVAAAKMSDAETWTAPWTQTTRAQIGGVLLECLTEVAQVPRTAVDPVTGRTVTEDQAAFYHSIEYVRGTKLGVIKVNQAVTDRLVSDGGAIHPRELPMLIPPKPWMGANDGAYLFNKASLMRFKDSVEQEKYLREAIQAGRVELVMEGLNVLGRTPWRINKPVFDIILKAWNSGERFGRVPPATFEEPEPVIPEDADMATRSAYIARHNAWAANVANNHSDRCSVNYKIQIAETFLDETIYFPHNVDFRGRAYPIPPHLNHIGDDLARSLLIFEKAKPLGERGLRWLKIHLANLHGFDKAGFDERVDWVHARLDEIKDSAKHPLEGRRWWMQADDPWQCLATCFELTAALESPDPLAFMSHLPIHQDGTCNGLQHYAAMGGDAAGAQQVNLSAGDRPSDVYTFVGKKVEALVDEDAAKGNEYALMLQGKITRKVVKQTVMTTVYGVTFIGARDQLEKQLRDRGDIPVEQCWNASSYLAKRVLTCIGDTFHSAKVIQNWLNLCARLISKSISPKRIAAATGELETSKKKKRGPHKVGLNRLKKEQMTSVVWTTALGLPIVQPYRKLARKQVMTNLQSIYISDPNVPSEVNSLKQATAFPPNFVHSLDATHMLLTALECNRRGLTFASVHDSYWTHASCIDEMASVIRDTFIQLHSADMMQRLADEFKNRYKGYRVPAVELVGGKATSLLPKLVAAGSRIRVPRSQAERYRNLGRLVEIVDDEDGASSAEGAESELAAADSKSASESLTEDILSSLELEEGASELDAESVEEAEEAAEKREGVDYLDAITNSFSLEELLPPPPKKGNFDVNDIRKSAYFFS